MLLVCLQKKLEIVLFSEIVVNGRSSKCPGSSSRIVRRQRESEKQKACNSAFLHAQLFFLLFARILPQQT